MAVSPTTEHAFKTILEEIGEKHGIEATLHRDLSKKWEYFVTTTLSKYTGPYVSDSTPKYFQGHDAPSPMEAIRCFLQSAPPRYIKQVPVDTKDGQVIWEHMYQFMQELSEVFKINTSSCSDESYFGTAKMIHTLKIRDK